MSNKNSAQTQALAKIEARHAELLADLNNITMERYLASVLPADSVASYTVKSLSAKKSWLRDADLHLQVPSRKDALALLDALPPVPLVFASFSTFCVTPESRLQEVTKGESRYAVKPIAPLSVTVSSFRETIRWWTLTEAGLTAVNLEMTPPESRVIRTHWDPVREEAHWDFSGVPEGVQLEVGQVSFLSSGDVLVYWTPDDNFREKLLNRTSLTRKTLS